MSLNSNDSAIKRFTYDWLIRFAELHPFEIVEYFNPRYRNQWDLVTPNERRPPDYPSKYAKISPMFTTLITRHKPYLFYSEYVNMKIINGKLKLKLPLHKKWKIIISEWCQFVGLQPGMISRFKDNQVNFYRQQLLTYIYPDTECRMTPDELKYLLKFGNFDTTVKIHANLTEAVDFSEICPLIAHCKDILLDVEDLAFSDKVANAFRKNQLCPNKLCLMKLEMSDKAVLEMFEYFSKLQNRPKFFYFVFKQRKPATLAKAIIDKYKCPGMKLKLFSMFNTQFDGFRMDIINNVELTFQSFYDE
uniref:F-box domain-containing protein n=1 Tax=Panagrellus redivivus TaxID=6233 RepID=A0A7E5A1D1_PANRE